LWGIIYVFIGKTLKGRYRIYDRLGAGGAAIVYLGRDHETGQMVIVKVVHDHLIDDQFIGRFEREIDLLQQLDTPHVIRLYDWALREVDPEIGHSLSYIVAEFVEGHTLADIIDTRGKFGEPDALGTARQVALGLSEIHQRGIVHRDVKSQNIMITPRDEVKLIDFGIAKGQNHATLTGASHFAGTLYYAPPEQVLNAYSVDHRADIYALGVILYEMLSARLPVMDRDIGTVASRVIAGRLDPLTGVSNPVEALVSDMLARNVVDRISSADEVIARIDDIVGTARPQFLHRPATTTAAFKMPRLNIEQPAAAASRSDFVLTTQHGEQLYLELPETIIGRSHPRHAVRPDIDLVEHEIEDARTVSRRHCRIFRQEDGRYYIEDLGSMNGTAVNGRLLEASDPMSLEPGDRIAVGHVLLRFERANRSG
jgi:serine/threonine protein kinase